MSTIIKPEDLCKEPGLAEAICAVLSEIGDGIKLDRMFRESKSKLVPYATLLRDHGTHLKPICHVSLDPKDKEVFFEPLYLKAIRIDPGLRLLYVEEFLRSKKAKEYWWTNYPRA